MNARQLTTLTTAFMAPAVADFIADAILN